MPPTRMFRICFHCYDKYRGRFLVHPDEKPMVGSCTECGRGSVDVWYATLCSTHPQTTTTTMNFTKKNTTEGKNIMQSNVATQVATVEAVGGFRGQVKIQHSLDLWEDTGNGRVHVPSAQVLWESEVVDSENEAIKLALAAVATMTTPKASRR